MWRKGLLISLLFAFTASLVLADNNRSISEDNTPIGVVKAKLDRNVTLTQADKRLAEENGLIEQIQSDPVRPSVRDVATTYLSEGFETWPPTDWVLNPASGNTGAWEQDMGTDYGPGNVVEGSYAAFFNDFDYSSGTMGTMTTPAIDLTSATAPRLVFYYWDGSGSDAVVVEVSTDGTTFTGVYTAPGTVSNWTETIVDLTSYAGNATVYVQFTGTSVWGYTNPHVDLVSVEEAPADPIISLSASAMNLGSVIPSMSSTATLTISNTGGADLNISSITSSDAAFTLDFTSGVVAASGTQAVVVTFAPLTSGDYTANLIITSDAASSPDTVALTGTGSATAGGPDLGGYTWASSFDGSGPTYAWIDTTGAVDAGIAFGDDIRGTIDLPFSFRYYGSVYTQITATTNAWIGMGPSTGYASSYWTNATIPTAAVPNNIIAPLWDDFKAGDSPGSTSSAHGWILSKTVGTEPNRQFVVIFYEIVRGTSDTDYFTFEVILDEATSDITVQYYDVSGNSTANNGIGATVGIENSDGTDGTLIGFNGVPQKVYDGEAIQFIAPPAPTDPIIELSEESSNLGSVLVGESQTHDITITNTGGADLVITDATVAAPFSTTFSGTIAPFGSAVATISFDPTTAGYFNETLTFNIAGAFTGTNTIALTGAAYSSDYVLEDFDGAVFPPTGWSTVDVDGGSAWNPDLSYIDPYSGTVSAEGMGCNNDYLITPLLVLPAGSPFISFWVGQESISYENSFEVMVSTTGTDPADFIQVADFPSTVPPSAGAWTPFTVDLTSYAGQDVHVAFHVYYSESAYYGFGVDDVMMPPVFVPANPPNTLFFSEYMEGSSNNKALEIYNGTDSIAHLNEYQVFQSSNGGGWAYYHIFPDTAELAPGDVWVIVTDTWYPAQAALVADEILSYPGLVFFNGDDARGLVRIADGDTTLIDLIGIPTEDPGSAWPVAGVATGTVEHTLVRKADVIGGNYGDWAMSAGTDAMNSEYIVLPQNTYQFIGAWPVLDFNEPNGNLASATVIAAGDTLDAAIDPDGEIDLFTFALTEDSQVNIHMFISGYSSLDGEIRLLAADSSSLATEDGYGSGGDEDLELILGAGTYYIVAGYYGDVLRASTGEYAISLNAVPYTILPGEDCEHAIVVTPGITTGTVPPMWYSFTPAETGSMTITSDINAQSNDTRVYVYDACGTSYIATDDDGGTGFTSLLAMDVVGGTTYFIEWDDYWDSDPFDWELSFQSGQPDFVVSSMTMSGDTLSVEVTNQGTADSPGYFGTDYHGLFVDNAYLGYVAESGVALAAGASYTYMLSGFNYDNLGVGEHGILFACDVDDDVTESDEMNNTDSITITIDLPPAAPRNLVATAGEGSVDLTWDPAPEESLPAPPVLQIAGATDVKTKNVFDSPEVLAKWARINAEQHADRDALTLGDDCTDPFIVTSLPFNETGSTEGFANSFTYGAGSDVVYQVTVAADGYLTASTCATATGDTKLQIFAADCATSLATNDDFCGLRSQITIPVTAGDYMVVVDGYSAGFLAYTVDITYAATLPTPDLAVTDMWYDGEAVWAEVSNLGDLSASSQSAHWFLNGVDVGYIYTPTLAPAAVDTIGLTGLVYGNVGAGEFTVSVELDFYDYMTELDEENNVGTIVVTIAEPDYVPAYNVYRDGAVIASDVAPIDFSFHGGYTDMDMTNGEEHCYTVTQILPDSSESVESNVACATPWGPVFGDFPFAEDFEALTIGGPLPAGWFVEELGTTDGPNWEIGDSVYFSLNSANYWHVQDHTIFAAIDDDGQGSGVYGDEILWTPWFDLTGTIAPRVLFAYSAQGGAGSELIIQPMEGAPANFVLPNNSGAWAGAQFDMTQFVGMTVKIGFHYNDGGSWAYGLGVDDIFINEAPAPGTIAGTVSNVADEVLGYAIINVDSPLFHFTTQADANGAYSIDVPAGTYDVNAWALNHEPALVTGVVVAEGATATVDFTLNLHLPEPYGLHRAMTEPGDISLEWGAPLPMGMLASDDNTFETFYWVSGPTTTAQFFAQHFHSPLPTGYSVNQVAVLATADAARIDFEKFLVVGSDSTGMPDMGAVLWNSTPVQAAEYPNVRWEVRNVNAVPASDDFWVLLQWPEGNTMGPYVATDLNGMPHANSFWSSDSGMTWNGIAYNFMIRAFVGDTPVRDQATLTSATVEATKLTTRQSFNAKEAVVENNGHIAAPGIYDASRELQSYNVYRTTDPETWGDAYENVAGTMFTDADFAFDTEYWYRVTAIYDEGESMPSNVLPVLEWTPLVPSFVENFDYPDDTPFDTTGWVADDGAGTPGNWNIEDMMAHFDYSPSQSDSFEMTLTSPVADLTDASIVRLRFYHLFDDYDDSDNGQFNMKISASTDGFATETVLWAHNDSIFGNIEGETVFNVSDIIAGSANAQVRFTAWGDGTFTMDNWWIDDVMLETDMFGNQPPMAFNMLTPADDDTVYITSGNLATDFLTLSWEPALDPDDDVVSYGIMVGDGLMNAIVFGDTTGTSVSIPYSAIYIALQLVQVTTVSGDWAIYATDGVDTTWAANGPFMLSIDATTVSIDNAQIPDVFALHQNYPNPFNPTTTIQYDLPEATDVTIMVYNMLGQRVATLVNSHQNAGYYNLRWNGQTNNGSQIASGIYLYRIQAGSFTKTMKMMYMK